MAYRIDSEPNTYISDAQESTKLKILPPACTSDKQCYMEFYFHTMKGTQKPYNHDATLN